MKIEDFIVWFPGAFSSTFLKTVRFNMLEDDKEYIEENHLYHCTPSREVAEKVIESGYLKPASGIFKNINSYGKASVCMFAGCPTVDSYMKNLSHNPYTNPSLITNAVEIDIHKEEINKNYKSRKFADEAVLYEGFCILPKNRAQIVQLVTDLKRDEQGNPLKNSQTGELMGIEIRKRTEEEIKESPNEYKPKEDYLKYMQIKRKELGFLEEKNILSKSYNNVNFVTMAGRLEGNEVIRSTSRNFIPTIKAFLERFKNQKQLDENIESKIKRIVSRKSFFREKKSIQR